MVIGNAYIKTICTLRGFLLVIIEFLNNYSLRDFLSSLSNVFSEYHRRDLVFCVNNVSCNYKVVLENGNSNNYLEFIQKKCVMFIFLFMVESQEAFQHFMEH